jgi:hypothetical protein
LSSAFRTISEGRRLADGFADQPRRVAEALSAHAPNVDRAEFRKKALQRMLQVSPIVRPETAVILSEALDAFVRREPEATAMELEGLDSPVSDFAELEKSRNFTEAHGLFSSRGEALQSPEAQEAFAHRIREILQESRWLHADPRWMEVLSANDTELSNRRAAREQDLRAKIAAWTHDGQGVEIQLRRSRRRRQAVAGMRVISFPAWVTSADLLHGAANHSPFEFRLFVATMAFGGISLTFGPKLMQALGRQLRTNLAE